MRLGWSYALVPVAAALAAFLFAEARFERKLEAHLAQAGGDPAAARAPADAATRSEVAIEDLLARPGGGSETSPIVPASGTYVTRDEFAASQEEMIQSLAALLNQYDQREDQETLDLLQAMYERLNRQQLYDYRQLAGRVDDLGRELVVSRGLAEEKIEELLGPEVPHETGGQEAPIEEE
jgi:hypothetical protein